MEDLNAQQIVLLTLLVSFVTSIATGITTVSLLEQAPEPITQTINRVVEKTVERVIEVPNENEEPVERIVETVVVNAEDLTIDAVQKNSGSIVRVYNRINSSKIFVGLGVIISSNGSIILDAANILQGEEYVGVYQSGEKELRIAFRESNNQFAVLEIEDEQTEAFAPAAFGDSQNVRLAQSVIALSGQDSTVVATGIVTSIDTADIQDGEGAGATVINAINTSLTGSDIVSGAILLNLKGEIIGARMNASLAQPGEFVPVNNIKAFLSSEGITTTAPVVAVGDGE